MDHTTLLKIARLRTLAARHGKAFDVVRFAGDRGFAKQTLSQVMDTDDEALLVAGLELMAAMKMVSSAEAPAPAPAPAPVPRPAAEAPAPRSGSRYVGRLR